MVPAILRYFSLFVCGFNLCSCNNTTHFNQKYFGVWFDPPPLLQIQLQTTNTNLTNGEDKLGTMISKISSSFQNVLVAPPVGRKLVASGGGRIPQAVASFNKHRTIDQTPIQLTMQFNMDGEMSNFGFIKKLADEANSIFPNTVRTLLLHLDELSLANQHSMTEHLNQAHAIILNESAAGRPQYKLGVHLPMKDYGRSISCLSPHLNLTLPRLPTILFSSAPKVYPFRSGLEKTIQKYTASLQDCKNRIKAVSPITEIGFLTLWPNVPNDAFAEASDLPNFWKGMNEWAVRTKTTVVLHEAFDNPTKKSLPYRNTGWWVLRENPLYGNYSFESKEEAYLKNGADQLLTENEKSDYKRIRSIVPFLTPTTSLGTRFNRKTTGVHFHQPVPENVELRVYFSLDELIIMISKIASKFSILSMPVIDDNLPVDDRLDIPSAVATFNRDYKPPDQPSVQLIMHVELYASWSPGTAIHRSFHRVTQLAEEANQIFPNTVTLLILNLTLKQLHHPDTWKAVIAQLEHVEGGRSSLKFPYRIGLLLDLQICLSSTPLIQDLLNAAAPTVGTLMFLIVGATYSAPTTRADQYARKIEQDFRSCKSAIQNFSATTEVGVSVGWPDAWNQTTGFRWSSLSYFWKEMDAIGGATNSTVIMYEAFDSAWKRKPYNTLGWWRLVENASYRHAGDYVFEAKEDLAILEGLQRKRDRDIESPPEPSGSIDKVSSPDGLTTGLLVTMSTLIVGMTAFLIRKKMRKAKSGRNILSKREIQGFFDGAMSPSLQNQSDVSGIENKAYDRSLDIPEGCFDIDEEGILGTGEFGTVFRGAIKIRNVQFQVAAKTTKPTCPASALRGLLSEIKIMSHIGKHDYILGIAGAHTEQLENGKVYVFTEFCALGSLDKYLRRMEQSSSKLSNALLEAPQKLELVLLDLQKWSFEITCGMEYLAFKRVVHADLATRNVLLTENKTAKISDFGLSRKLYNYEEYVKTKKEPIPWRWMPPESLRKMVFNQKTDVWSYGITLWEIFSLGDLPYAGISWDVDWVSQLDGGLRLGKPKYDVKDWYSIMAKCWEAEPATRPSFSEIKGLWANHPAMEALESPIAS